MRSPEDNEGPRDYIVPLTSKLQSSGSADDSATAVDCQTLIRTGISDRFWAADNQTSSYQCVAQIQAERDLRAIHQPPEKHGGLYSGGRGQFSSFSCEAQVRGTRMQTIPQM